LQIDTDDSVKFTGTTVRVLQEEVMTQDGDISKYLQYLQNYENSNILLKGERMFSMVKK